MVNDEKLGCLKIGEMLVNVDEMTDEELAKIEEEIVKDKNELRKIIDERLEIGDNVNPQNQEQVDAEPIEETIKKIVEKQYQHSIIKAVRNVKRSRNLINTNETQLEKYISDQAKKYGQTVDILTSDIDEYKNYIEQINVELNKIKKCVMKQKEEILGSEYEKVLTLVKKREQRKIIKKSEEYKEYRTQINNLNRDLMKEMENTSPSDNEIKKITDEIEKMEKADQLMICENDIQELKKDIIEARKISIECDKQLEQFTVNLKDYIETATKDGETKLINVSNEKVGFMQKIFGSIFNKIGGANKFEESVVKVLKNKIEKMKTTVVPEVIQKVKDDGIESMANIIEKIQKTQGIPEGTVDTKAVAGDYLLDKEVEFKEIINEGNAKRVNYFNAESELQSA